MKKRLSVSVLFISLFLLSSCDSGQSVKADDKLPSVDLSSVSIGDIMIGDSIQDVDLTAYTPTDIYQLEDYDYTYSELRIATDDGGSIIKIHVILPCSDFSIDGKDHVDNINEVMNILGGDYNEYWFDYEQSLKANTYVDKETGYSATFVYVADKEGQLVWLVFDRL